MSLLPSLPRERVAVGFAMMSASGLLGLLSRGWLQAACLIDLGGVGAAIGFASLLRLRRDARFERLSGEP